jgi:ABC-2 type transport system ATP-binding protein
VSRVSRIDRGRVVALDRPAALSAQASTSQRIRLHCAGSLGEAVLQGVPEVGRVERHGQDIVVFGSGDLLTAVVLAFDRAGLRAEVVRSETTNLEDAFLALTDESSHATTTTNAETKR